ncbi:MAG: PilZ domain-containing protein, partial [candidate division NC10 bacterium]
LYRRVHFEVPVIFRPLKLDASPGEAARRGVTSTLAPGGLGMILDEQFPVGTPMEVLVRFEGDLLAADVEVVSVIPQGSQFLHNCRFTRLGTADRNWLIEYLRVPDGPPA